MKQKTTNIKSEKIEDKALSDEDIDVFFKGSQNYDYNEDTIIPAFADDDISDKNLDIETDSEPSEETIVSSAQKPPVKTIDIGNIKSKMFLKTTPKTKPREIHQELITPEFADLSGLLDYDEDQRKQNNFRYEYLPDELFEEESTTLESNFHDFLVMSKISGKSSGFGSSALYPSERIVDNGKKIKIFDDKHSKAHKNSDSTKVIVNKNEDGVIESIEIQCKCGETTIIDLDYTSQDENDVIFSKIVPDTPVKIVPKEKPEIVPVEFRKSSSVKQDKPKLVEDYPVNSFTNTDEENDDSAAELFLDFSDLREDVGVFEEDDDKKNNDSMSNSDSKLNNNDDDDEPLLTIDDLDDV